MSYKVSHCLCTWLINRFISLANRLHTDITKQHEAVTQALTQIYKENELAEKLYHQLEHEKIVLDERIAVCIYHNAPKICTEHG